MAAATIFSRFLESLRVPHTAGYSDRLFRSMTFKSLFGLSHLLSVYGIDNETVSIADREELMKLRPPFLAQTRAGVFVIVTRIDPECGLVTYDSLGAVRTVGMAAFERAWNGIALLAFPGPDSAEPDFRAHRLADFIGRCSGFALIAALVLLAAYFFVTRQLYTSIATILITILDIAGIYLSTLLLLKSLHIHTRATDRVCSILEQGGCDTIMSLKVSKLFGVFSWSEVGLAYFGVSLVTLLVEPATLPALALCNVCCLPYTVWSIWYQRFRAHHWCTLCVGVQSTLWLLFFCYLGSGFVARALPVTLYAVALVALYVAVVLLINRLLLFARRIPVAASAAEPEPVPLSHASMRASHARPQLLSASVLRPAALNRIHFGGNHSPLTPRDIIDQASLR